MIIKPSTRRKYRWVFLFLSVVLCSPFFATVVGSVSVLLESGPASNRFYWWEGSSPSLCCLSLLSINPAAGWEDPTDELLICCVSLFRAWPALIMGSTSERCSTRLLISYAKQTISVVWDVNRLRREGINKVHGEDLVLKWWVSRLERLCLQFHSKCKRNLIA